MEAELPQFSNSTSADSARSTMLTPERRALLIELLEEFRADQREVARVADCTNFAGRKAAYNAQNAELSAAGIVFRLRDGK